MARKKQVEPAELLAAIPQVFTKQWSKAEVKQLRASFRAIGFPGWWADLMIAVLKK
jgi:hypothetical protein